MTKVLVVDDDTNICDLLKMYLEKEGYEVKTANDGVEGMTVFKMYEPDIVLLDIMMPKKDGWQVCREIREKSSTPIIMLTAKGETADKVNGLEMGADDYITKPFLPLELVARVKAQLRRYKRYNAGGTAEDEDVLVVSGLVLNVKTHQCTLNERPLALTPTEFSILQILCQRRGQVVNAEELFHAIWGDEYFYKSNNTITVHIRHLREKMGDSAENPRYIKTVWGCGYKIEG